jgi:15-cis-phytoene synthase
MTSKKHQTRLFRSIFKGGSKTYFYSSVFFDKPTRDEVSTLYSFVRVADNFVDQVPQDRVGFEHFCSEYKRCLEHGSSTNTVIHCFCELLRRRNFSESWVDAFLDAMEMDLYKSRYETLDEVVQYMFGSAEVIGLMMARILELPEESFAAAQKLGRAMQYINFIRDIAEDLSFNRIYLPSDAMQGHDLTDLNYEYLLRHNKVKNFQQFIREQISIYLGWQKEAEAGFRFIPRRYLIPIRTASEMYKWTAKKISTEPLEVFAKKIKPSVPYIVFNAGKYALNPL